MTVEVSPKTDGVREFDNFDKNQLRQLIEHLRQNPTASADAWKSPALVPTLLELKNSPEREVRAQARVALALLGHAPNLNGRGIRILSLDGGGSRGIILIVVLRLLEQLCGKRIHEMFDYVCGTSTGAIIASLVCLKREPLDKVEMMYRQMSMELFNKNNLLGIGQLFLTHAFYDAKILENIIRQYKESEMFMCETATDPLNPKVAFVSTLVNQSVVQPFLFCNYRHRPGNPAAYCYPSTTEARIWEAIMASTAAPGYLEEVKIGPHVYQDGGLLSNNPCAIAVHEARMLWGRKVPIQCVISLGTGFYRRPMRPIKAGEVTVSTSLREKLTKVVASATDTEAVHVVLQDLLPENIYFRFNPELSEDISIDERRPQKLELLCTDTVTYLARERGRLEKAAVCLMQERTAQQKTWDWFEEMRNKAVSTAWRYRSSRKL